MANTQNEQDMTTKTKEESKMEEKVKQLWAIWFAGVLILVGLVLVADNQGWLPDIQNGTTEWDKVEVADWIILGAGLWGLAINVFRTISEEWPAPKVVDWVLSGLLTLVGASQFFDLDDLGASVNGELVGAVVIIGLGVALLFNTLRNKEQA